MNLFIVIRSIVLRSAKGGRLAVNSMGLPIIPLFSLIRSPELFERTKAIVILTANGLVVRLGDKFLCIRMPWTPLGVAMYTIFCMESNVSLPVPGGRVH